jgi:outer membrane protein assembly factor BamE
MPSLFTLRLPLVALTLSSWALLLGGCTTASNTAVDTISRVISVYKVDVVQGNVVTREQIAAVVPGKTRAEVRDVLGSPLLADPFHPDRWDYAFSLKRDGKVIQRRHVVVWFEEDRVKQVDAPADLPSEREFVTSINPSTGQKPRPEPKLALTDAERAAIPAPAAVAAASAPVAPARSYPPLESL